MESVAELMPMPCMKLCTRCREYYHGFIHIFNEECPHCKEEA